jgi:hypothetical protein
MSDSIQVVSTAPRKATSEMTEDELTIQISDHSEIYEYLTRQDASYEERCFAESILKQIETLKTVLEGRRR